MITLTRIDPDQNMQRYYHLSVQPDLFGGYMLMKVWGRIGQAGQIKQLYYPDFHSANQAAQDHARRKQRKGYQL